MKSNCFFSHRSGELEIAQKKLSKDNNSTSPRQRGKKKKIQFGRGDRGGIGWIGWAFSSF